MCLFSFLIIRYKWVSHYLFVGFVRGLRSWLAFVAMELESGTSLGAFDALRLPVVACPSGADWRREDPCSSGVMTFVEMRRLHSWVLHRLLGGDGLVGSDLSDADRAVLRLIDYTSLQAFFTDRCNSLKRRDAMVAPSSAGVLTGRPRFEKYSFSSV